MANAGTQVHFMCSNCACEENDIIYIIYLNLTAVNPFFTNTRKLAKFFIYILQNCSYPLVFV